MNRNALQGILAIGILVGAGGLILAFLQPPNSAEFFISIASCAIGLAIILLALLMNRIMR